MRNADITFTKQTGQMRLTTAVVFLLVLVVVPFSRVGAETIEVSAGGWHTCSLKTDGTVACWGYNNHGQSTPPAGTFTEVTAGGYHTCGVKTNGAVACWGYNYYGQSTPPAGTFTEIDAGDYHTCGVKTDGTIACWGYNSHGQSAPPAETFTEVSAGWAHTCGVKTDGTVACWGAGKTNTGVFPEYGQSTPPVGTFTEVSLGYIHTCGVKTDGTVACWGNNSWGKSNPPAGAFIEMSAGGDHTCGVKTNGTGACWGGSWIGQTSIPGGTFTDVSAGGDHTCWVRTNGTVVCEGDNGHGQAPDVTVSPSTLPDGIKGIPYSQIITSSGGLSPYTFKKISGSLPAGLTLTTGGKLSGTSGSTGEFAFTVQAVDKNDIAGWKIYTLTVKADTPPTLGALTPSVLTSAPGAAQTFTAIYSDADGFGDIKRAHLRVHTLANGIWLRYERTTNKLYLRNDAGTAAVGSCTPGGTGTLTNTQGSLNCAATTVTASGNKLTINWNITPSAAFASSTKKNVYTFVRDMSDLTAGWIDKGDWTITP